MRKPFFTLTVTSVIILLMTIIAQVIVVEANPFVKPRLCVRSPESSHIYVSNPMVTILFYYSMENSLAQIYFTYSLDNNANSTLHASIGKSNNIYYYTVSSALRNLAEGTHTLTVYVHCSNGTVNSIINSLITVDATLAQLFNPTIISPLSQATYNSSQVPLTYTINKEVLKSYYFLDSNSSDLRYFDGNITLPSLSEGQHEITLAVTTITGPTNQQPYQTIKTVIFFINTTTPTLTPSSTPNHSIPEFPATLAMFFFVITPIVVLVSFRKMKTKHGQH